MILNNKTRKLQVSLGGTVTANQLAVTVVFHDVPAQTKDDFSDYQKSIQFATTNDTNEVDICDAPTVEGVVREIDYIAVYNADTTNEVFKLMIDDNGTNRIQVEMQLATTETAVWTKESGWNIET